MSEPLPWETEEYIAEHEEKPMGPRKCYRKDCNNEAVDGSFCSEACREKEIPSQKMTFEEKLALMKTWKATNPDVDIQYEQSVINSLT